MAANFEKSVSNTAKRATDNGPIEPGWNNADFGPLHFLIYLARDLFLALLCACSVFVVIESFKNTSISFYLNMEILAVTLMATGIITYLFFSDSEAGVPLVSKIITPATEKTMVVLLIVFSAATALIGTIRIGSPGFVLVVISGIVIIVAFVFKRC